ncbi:transcription factor grauzone-like [Eurosta solidaginis]|uniref:transcription factor grauzone-like n=1 Tax=Eurosta solidaginis TaxID=178769 RepID=UPI003530C26B
MICRLCLRTLIEDYAVSLFESSQAEEKLVKLIAKYFQLEITPDDQISTSLCEDCSEHLEEFHKFWLYVDLKQNSLSSEFLAVKCGDIKEDNSTPIDVTDDNVDNQGEILLDLKDIPIAQDNFGSGNDLALPLENINVTPDIKIDIETDTESANNLQTGDEWKNDDESFDDDIPLLNLKHKIHKSVVKASILGESMQRDSKANIKNYARVNKKTKKNNKVNVSELSDKPESEKHIKAKQNEEIIGTFMLLNCDLCALCVENYNELRLHFAQVHKKNAYVKCCGKTFHKPSLLAEHVQWHTNPGRFKCDICSKQLRSSKCLASHMKMIHCKKEVDKEIVRCHICSKGFRSQKCLENHITKHKDDRDYPCEICNKSFANPHRLRKHIQDIHENLKRHICDICGKTFKFKPSFERHVLEHQGIVDPPVQCDICGEWSKNKHVNRLHQFKHSQVDTECKYCGRKCVSRTALRGHINYMHKKKYDLQCQFCEKTFKEARNLEEHMATHTGTQLYSCPHCAKECRSKSNMYVHIKRMHVNEWIQSKVARSNDPNLKASLTNLS